MKARWPAAAGARILGLFVVCLSLFPATLAAAADLEDLLFDLQLVPLGGEAPPAFALESLDGKKVALGDYRGKPLFLYFWASW